ncbi:hypothetical protein, unlikely [Trypanosoma brucei gambiense DAL972]|uniref:Uncharacterized protein n=1 Tax=Trypanosoma brucei gambiense (strain MHOM/CI/86/DAL972) TaxID=679716 RepID=C9ZRW7_TRYB9|nr:hypothetical protein, unlikely [Trypanosoma brucei gambiense DAL972]CBH12103.1 hypothetical protein, unlikely [Trypanosoma brucei gambiense DAL972]|eukprot:XP_011774386.1 hypothetical protein, unlikely [Trypanosoma brucei gambiense DAL972]
MRIVMGPSHFFFYFPSLGYLYACFCRYMCGRRLNSGTYCIFFFWKLIVRVTFFSTLVVCIAQDFGTRNLTGFPFTCFQNGGGDACRLKGACLHLSFTCFVISHLVDSTSNN